MSGVCAAARDLAGRMACSYLAAAGIEPDGDVVGLLAEMLLPAAEVVTETHAMAREIAARLDAQAALLAELAVRAAEYSGELDMPAALADGWGYAGGSARKEAPGG